MGKNKLFVLLGMSGAGKSSIEKIINESGAATKITSTTTRSRRSFEVDGEDYYFLSDTVFKIYLKDNQYAEWSSYPTVSGDALYGINKNDIHLDKQNQICVVNPLGYCQLIDSLGSENVVGIYITRDDKERVIGALKRDKNDFENTLKEVVRRYEADKRDFFGIEKSVKYIIENKDLHETARRVVEIIEEETRC